MATKGTPRHVQRISNMGVIAGRAFVLVAVLAGSAEADEPQAAPPAPSAPTAPAPPAPATLAAPATPATPAPPAAPAASAAPATPAAETAPAPLGITASLAGTAQHQEEDQRTFMMVAAVQYTRPAGPRFFGRIGWVHADDGATSLSNPLIGASLPFSLPRSFGLDLHVFGTLPVGTGGGDDADPNALRASLMGTDWHGPMFAPNHLTAAGGAKLSFAHPPVFASLDASLYYLSRVRGEEIDPIGPSVTLTATKLIVAFAVSSRFSAYAGAAQIRYWGEPEFLQGSSPSARDDHYAFAGLEAGFVLGGQQVRPGLLYARAVDLPKSGRSFQLAELSVSISF